MTIQLIQSDITKYLAGNQWLVQRGYIEKYQAVLCDPPYFLASIVKRFGSENAAPAKYGSDGMYQRSSKGFMGQTWDGFDSPQSYQEWVTEWATLMLDFMHPGAVGLFFGGRRTYHRLVCGLEDAGWEIHDSIIAWTFSQGIPLASKNISKAIDKQAGVEREVVGQRNDGRYAHKFQDINSGLGKLTNQVSNVHKIGQITAPATPEAAQWDGYGTALAPSYEPIVIARAPRQGYTYAECALRYGTGALNVDGGRIATTEENGRHLLVNAGRKSLGIYGDGLQGSKVIGTTALGRWPKNTLLTHHPDCTDSECVPGCHVREMGEQSGELAGPWGRDSYDNNQGSGMFGLGGVNSQNELRGKESGTAARFFAQFRYVPKANNFEREAGLLEIKDGLSSEKRQWLEGELHKRGIKPIYED